MCGLSYAAVSEDHSSCSVQAPHCRGFSRGRAWALGIQAPELQRVSPRARVKHLWWVPGLSCSDACGIFLDQARWQVDSATGPPEVLRLS